MTKTNAPQPRSAAKAIKPVDAATLIIVDAAAGEPRILMGQRRKDLVFMPGKYVFPGGRVDKPDHDVACCADLPAREIDRLLIDMKGTPSAGRARALALAALRETFEETGLLIGGVGKAPATEPSVATATAVMASEPGRSWQSFRAHGLLPRLDQMTFFARAITPPGRSRRYDTRFFCVDAAAISHDCESRDDELLSLHWLTLDETRAFDLASITRIILEDLAERLDRGSVSTTNLPVPYYYFQNGSFHRRLIAWQAPNNAW